MATAASAILLLFVAIMFTDFLLFLLMWSLLHSMRGAFLLTWLLIPPFAQPLAFVIGPLTLFLELPRLGRLFAAVVAFGLLNAVVTVFIILVSTVDSWAFHVLGFLAVCIVKFALIICTNAHISSLEVALDLSFINTHQAQGACQLISSELSTPDLDASRRMQRSHFGSSRGLQPHPLDSGAFVRQGTNSTSASTHSQQVLDDVQLSPHRASGAAGTFSLLLSRPSTPLRSNTPDLSDRHDIAMASMSSMSRKPRHGGDARDPAPF